MNQVPVRDIITATCKHYKINQKEFLSKTRRREIVWPRQVAMYLARRITKRSTVEIGGYFGGMDHTTILHGAKAVEIRLADSDYGPKLNADTQAITKDLCLPIPDPQVFSYFYNPMVVTMGTIKLNPMPDKIV